ncbi:DUF2269 family protein [Virgibacillus alimentarius]|uniref:Membrane protein n=1 Tax=Virgibacillus alimentarius TaxID=698769 RepID=A0ABS4SA07_9BACI|nr:MULTISPECIES: DUF2269 family protein [Virgibacillus]MBP2257227.1 putative membrane protein [Virgibacillus alimentarius]HLR67390.1 DUF2269 family protein [Virgibacillus sp.]
MSFYDYLVFIHVFSAIIGVGPGFVMTYIVTKASNMTELKHAYRLRKRIHVFIMIGGALLLITGIWMGLMNTYLFHQGWYIISFILFMIVLGFGPALLAPRLKPIKEILKRYRGEEIPEKYYHLSKQLFLYERITNLILIVIIALMILKPF